MNTSSYLLLLLILYWICLAYHTLQGHEFSPTERTINTWIAWFTIVLALYCWINVSTQSMVGVSV